MDLSAQYVKHLRAQAKTPKVVVTDSFPCPYCDGRVFQGDDQLFDHVKLDHPAELPKSSEDTRQSTLFRKILKDEALRKSKTLAERNARETSHVSSEATAGGGSTPDLTQLSLENSTKDYALPGHRSTRKRAAGSDTADFQSRASPRKEFTRRPKIVDPDNAYVEEDLEYSRDIPYTKADESSRPQKPSFSQLYEPNQSKPPRQPAYNVTRRIKDPDSRALNTRTSSTAHRQRQPGILEIPRSDPRYPGLLLQPDSRPISQEQLASEVKSIYAGLTMVETKCIHVDRAQAQAVADPDTDPNSKLANDHWQALIALHRTLLHEHHDFFLASQHPSASPALRRLASKYQMPARMWKHGMHSFLELLRRRLPESLDYMLAFIYLAYQMMALLYETVPTFEDSWIECLGDLGRYRMAVEDEDLRDRETWAGVARSWYSKAADRSPAVGRLYHHLAILARPNALQQLYYYARSLTCVEPFMSARESILTLLDPILGRSVPSYSHSLPIDTSFIRAHGIQFSRLSPESFNEACTAFLDQLDNHIGRVTAKWKEQGVYVAITNIAGFFDYGAEDSTLRFYFQSHAEKLRGIFSPDRSSSPSEDESGLPVPHIQHSSGTASEAELSSRVGLLLNDYTFRQARHLTFSTLSLVLGRIGDKNVLPHVHVLLAFLLSFTSVPYVASLVDSAPWEEITNFLNTLSKSERLEPLLSAPLFSFQDHNDNRPLPEDYHIRGQVWSQWYFPDDWFAGEHDEDERSIELASTVKSRTERILRLGYQISSNERWIQYDSATHTWSVAQRMEAVKSGQEGGGTLTPPSFTSLGADVMETDSGYPVDDSPEMRALQAAAQRLDNEPTEREYSLLQNFAVMVCDTNLLLNQPEVFKVLSQNSVWSVVVPESVVTQISIMSESEGVSVRAEATAALENIQRAIQDHKSVRIVAADGKNVTSRFLDRQMRAMHYEMADDPDEVMIGVTRQESDLAREASASQSDAKPAVLITEDRATRLKAAAVGVASIATSVIRKVLIGPRRKSDPEWPNP